MTRIVVDWGTSSFRAYRFGAGDAIVAEHTAPAGILSVEGGAFEATLHREIGPWLEGGAEVFFSGMITSRNGWVETPYAPCPASIAALAKASVERRIGDLRMRFLPGVAARTPTPDVLRGEEIQIFGSVAPNETATLVLPGTHSKWAQVESGLINGFRTFMTGEVFAALRQHTILGRLIPPGDAPFDQSAFLAGVAQGADPGSAGLLNDVFTTRSGVLLEAFSAREIVDRLSGLLIGHECAAGLKLSSEAKTIILVGEAALCERYSLALKSLDVATRLAPARASVEGFRRLMQL